MSRPTTTLRQQVEELEREVATRRRVYPGWVRKGKITPGAAGHRLRCLDDLIAYLRTYVPDPQSKLDL